MQRSSLKWRGRALPDISRAVLQVLWAGAVALALICACGLVNDEYYQRWPFFGDTASYLIRDFSIIGTPDLSRWREESLLYSLSNPRDPLRTAFYAVLSPRQIFSVNGHLYFSAAAAFLFFLSCASCVWTRTKSLAYSLAAPGIVLLFSGLYSPMYGMPSHLPDPPSALLLGAALFTLFVQSQRRSMMVFLSGGILGLAALSRYHVWVYGVFLLCPVVTLYATEKFMRDGRSVRAFVLEHLWFVGGLALTGGIFIVYSAKEVFYFYSIAGYGLDKTVVAALSTTGEKLVTQTLGVSALGAMGLILCGYVALGWEDAKRASRFDSSAVLWAVVAIPFLILVVMRVEDDISQTYYMLPGLVLATAAPFCLKVGRRGDGMITAFNRFATGLVLVLPMYAFGLFSAATASEEFLYPRPRSQQLYAFNRAAAELIVSHLPKESTSLPVLDSNFDYYARYIIPTMQYSLGERASFGNVFQIRQSQWQVRSALPQDGSRGARFTGELVIDEKLIMPEIVARVDVFMALSNPYAAEASEVVKDDYTRALAAHVASSLRSGKDAWKLIGELPSPFGSDVLIYLNRNSLKKLVPEERANVADQ